MTVNNSICIININNLQLSYHFTIHRYNVFNFLKSLIEKEDFFLHIYLIILLSSFSLIFIHLDVLTNLTFRMHA